MTFECFGAVLLQSQVDVLSLLRDTSPMAKIVLLLLLVFSVWSWGIILSKTLLLRRVRTESETFWRIFHKGKSLSEIATACESLRFTPLVPVFNAGADLLGRPGATLGCDSTHDSTRFVCAAYSDRKSADHSRNDCSSGAVYRFVRNRLGCTAHFHRTLERHVDNIARGRAGYRGRLDHHSVWPCSPPFPPSSSITSLFIRFEISAASWTSFKSTCSPFEKVTEADGIHHPRRQNTNGSGRN